MDSKKRVHRRLEHPHHILGTEVHQIGAFIFVSGEVQLVKHTLWARKILSMLYVPCILWGGGDYNLFIYKDLFSGCSGVLHSRGALPYWSTSTFIV